VSTSEVNVVQSKKAILKPPLKGANKPQLRSGQVHNQLPSQKQLVAVESPALSRDIRLQAFQVASELKIFYKLREKRQPQQLIITFDVQASAMLHFQLPVISDLPIRLFRQNTTFVDSLPNDGTLSECHEEDTRTPRNPELERLDIKAK